MSYDEPFFTGGYHGMSTADMMGGYDPERDPVYTDMPEGRMQVEQAGIPARTHMQCGHCPVYENPQRPPMRKVSLDDRIGRAMTHYPPDHDTVARSCRRCVSGFSGGCEHMEGSKLYSPSASMTISPMTVDMNTFIMFTLFIIFILICVSYSRQISDLRSTVQRLQELTR